MPRMVDRALTRTLHLHVISFTPEGARQRFGNGWIIFGQQHVGHLLMLGHELP